MSDAFWIALFAGIPSILGAMVTAFLAVKAARTSSAAAIAATAAVGAATKAAVKAEDVENTLSTVMASTNAKLEAIAVTGEKTHKLANSAMLEQKRLVAESSRAKADVTKDSVDIATASAAEKIYRDHAARNGSP